jgi:hypothetical protein
LLVRKIDTEFMVPLEEHPTEDHGAIRCPWCARLKRERSFGFHKLKRSERFKWASLGSCAVTGATPRAIRVLLREVHHRELVLQEEMAAAGEVEGTSDGAEEEGLVGVMPSGASVFDIFANPGSPRMVWIPRSVVRQFFRGRMRQVEEQIQVGATIEHLIVGTWWVKQQPWFQKMSEEVQEGIVNWSSDEEQRIRLQSIITDRVAAKVSQQAGRNNNSSMAASSAMGQRVRS